LFDGERLRAAIREAVGVLRDALSVNVHEERKRHMSRRPNSVVTARL
jgi:hypothetical protein